MSPQNWLSGDGTLLCLQWTAFLLLPFMRAPELKGKDTWIITRTQYAQDFVGVPQSCSPCLVPWRHGAGSRPLSAPGFYLGLLDPDNVWTRSSSFLFSVGLKPSGGHWSSFCYAILQSSWINDDSQKNIPWGAEQNEWILKNLKFHRTWGPAPQLYHVLWASDTGCQSTQLLLPSSGSY